MGDELNNWYETEYPKLIYNVVKDKLEPLQIKTSVLSFVEKAAYEKGNSARRERTFDDDYKQRLADIIL